MVNGNGWNDALEAGLGWALLDPAHGGMAVQATTSCRAGDGDDVLIGGDGDDDFDGGDGDDVAFLGDGDDDFVWNPGDHNDVVEGQSGTDGLPFTWAQRR